MERKRLIAFGRGQAVSEETIVYWLGVDTAMPRVYRGQFMVLARECKTVVDLERVAAEIREDLDAALNLARAEAAST